MENEKNIKRTAQDYAGTVEDIKNSKGNWCSMIFHGRYKGALGKMILNEFLDGKNGRPAEFTERDILIAIQEAGGREFTDYAYDGHRRDPDWYFVKEILDWCLRHHMFIERCNGVYRRKIFETLKNKEE